MNQGEGPANCPSLRHQDLAAESTRQFAPVDPGIRQAGFNPGGGRLLPPGKGLRRRAPAKPRIVEIISSFARRMNYRRWRWSSVWVRREAKVCTDF